MEIDRIMPFLWLKRESKEELGKELKAMLDMGITSFVVESRVHDDFCGEKWFEEMDYIMEFAHSHGMKVWLLDDKSYPTGSANGVLLKKKKEKKARRIKAMRTDICGKKKDIRVRMDLNGDFGEKLLAVYLAKRGEDYECLQNPIDVTDHVYGEYLYLDLEGGYYSVIAIVETSDHCEREGYIDMMDPDSVRELIDEVYEPHYKRYKKYFGDTFYGFFSDEPRFNCNTYWCQAITNAYDGKIGKYGIAYPWNKKMEESFLNDGSILGLWFNIGGKTAEIRCRYMELVTECYAENFVGQLSNWCKEHHVLYTGHIIEDMDAHTALMCSAGNYFKAMKGADIASVDVVLHQVRSLENDGNHMAPLTTGYSDSSFFNYTLMKLASSCAHIQENKKGRALCEVFGAYGWGESVEEMLFQANHALVRGVNAFIPHAFTSEFDNPDCPPHFYAGGLNPADKGYKLLFDYMSKVSGIFSGGKAIIEVGVLYHAQAEWSGGKFDPCDVIAKELMNHQIDFDFIDFETLSCAQIGEEGIQIGENVYKVLVVPYFEIVPEGYKAIIERLHPCVIYADQGGKGIGQLLKERLGYEHKSIYNLRVLRYQKNREYFVMFFNEGEEPIQIHPQDYCNGFHCGTYANDYVTHTYVTVTDNEILIEPLQAVICEENRHGTNTKVLETKNVSPSSDIYLREYDKKEYTFYKHVENSFFNVNRYDECPNFAGFVKVIPLLDWDKIQLLSVEYDAEFCELHCGNSVYSSIGGKLVCDMRKVSGDRDRAYIILGCSLANVLKDEYTKFNYINPCKLLSLSVSEKN